jgi:hypothetical protein
MQHDRCRVDDRHIALRTFPMIAMNRSMQRRPSPLWWLCAVLCLPACSTGELDLSIADAPVDDADNVFIEISGVELQPSGGDRTTITFDSPIRIDLLAQTGGASSRLLGGEVLDAGDYDWIRLLVNAQSEVRDSYIMIDGNEYELAIPTGAEDGLQTDQGFNVPRNGTIALTIDFDLRASVREPETDGDDYLLMPVLRLVDDAEAGMLSGTVDAAVIADQCGIDAKAAVYLFDAEAASPDDVDGVDPDPVSSAIVPLDGEHAYAAAFLEAGDYRIAFTCDAADDRVDSDDAGIVFTGVTTVTISANQTTQHDFLP